MSRRRSAALVWFAAVAMVAGCADADGGAPPAEESVATSVEERQGTNQGVQLTVTGSVGLVFGDHAFELGDDDERVLVVSPDTAVAVRRGVTVRVTGVVEPLRLSALRDRRADIDERRLRAFEGRSALIAVVVEAVPDDGGAAP